MRYIKFFINPLKIIRYILYKIKNYSSLDFYVHKKRIKISNKLSKLFDSTIKYGYFKGLKLSNNTWWGYTSRPAMFFGIYEKELLNKIIESSKDKKIFIDVGAADGYYPCGFLLNNFFNKAYCFEKSKLGRKIITQNATLNNINKKLIIFDTAEIDFLKKIPNQELENSVFLFDIEGYELDLIFLNKENLINLKKSILFIEIHEWTYSNEHKKNYLDLAKDHFEILEIKTYERDLSNFIELKKFSDNDRWLICSEGRPQSMKWLKLSPK